MINIATIEDCLELAAGLQQGPKIVLDKSDITIMYSIARQVFKGVALTDRQFALMQQKLTTYADQFKNIDCDFDFAITQTRHPLRQIDRSKYIKVVDNKLKVRFPFRKTEIMELESCSRNAEGYSHDKGSHSHWFALNEINVFNLVTTFKNKNFVIDEEILDAYEKIKIIKSNPQDHLSGIYSGELKNIHPNLKIVETDNLILLDRKFKYGFSYVENIKEPTSLPEKIASRTDKFYLSKPSSESINSIFQALWRLERFPLIVILDKGKEEIQLYECITHYRDILSNEEQSVLFRDEEKDSGFNTLIHDRKLNNWVDKNTKIVYISMNKLPKLLINSDWKPSTAFAYSSSINKHVNDFITFNCDLIVFREDEVSPFRKYSRLYGQL